MRFVFTTSASLEAASLAGLSESAQSETQRSSIAALAFRAANDARHCATESPRIAYLGTVDFVKMHPGFFDAIDGLPDDDIRVSVWGEVDPSGPVAARARAMRHPERVKLCGADSRSCEPRFRTPISFSIRCSPITTARPRTRLSKRCHSGWLRSSWTMRQRRRLFVHGETGLVAQSTEEAGSLLQTLLSSPDLRERLSRNAAMHVAETRTPAISAHDLMVLWLGMLSKPPTGP